MKKIIGLITILLLFTACKKKENPLVGEKAYNFNLKNINEQQIQLNDFKGQKIMLHFWADWCASCREEFFTLQNVYELIKQNNSTLIGVNVGQTRDHIKELVNEYGVSFPMLRDESKNIAEEYVVRGLPMNYFITKKCKIYKVITGWMNKDEILKIFNEMD